MTRQEQTNTIVVTAQNQMRSFGYEGCYCLIGTFFLNPYLMKKYGNKDFMAKFKQVCQKKTKYVTYAEIFKEKIKYIEMYLYKGNSYF